LERSSAKQPKVNGCHLGIVDTGWLRQFDTMAKRFQQTSSIFRRLLAGGIKVSFDRFRYAIQESDP